MGAAAGKDALSPGEIGDGLILRGGVRRRRVRQGWGVMSHIRQALKQNGRFV